jgi:hypothetical protein
MLLITPKRDPREERRAEETRMKKVMRRSGTRWKGSRAAEFALEEPISSLYDQMQKWQDQPLESLLTPSSVVLTANPHQMHIFNRACFGRPILAATAGTSSSASLVKSAAPSRKL